MAKAKRELNFFARPSFASNKGSESSKTPSTFRQQLLCMTLIFEVSRSPLLLRHTTLPEMPRSLPDILHSLLVRSRSIAFGNANNFFILLRVGSTLARRLMESLGRSTPWWSGNVLTVILGCFSLTTVIWARPVFRRATATHPASSRPGYDAVSLYSNDSETI